jgi:hypothetical protein
MGVNNPVTAESIGAVPISRQVIAGVNMSGGGNLENDITLDADGGGGSGGNKFFHALDIKATGTNGGFTNAGVWNTRVLNTVDYSSLPGVSLFINKISVIPGSYYIKASAAAYECGRHRLRMFDSNNNLTIITGLNAFAVPDAPINACSIATIEGFFTVAAPTNIELQHWTENNNFGSDLVLGIASNNGLPEIYANVVLSLAS